MMSVSPEWLVSVGGPELDASSSTAVHPDGGAYVTARFSKTVDFDPGPGETFLTSAGDIDAALLRYSAAGELLWARRMGGPNFDLDVKVTVDRAGNAYMATQLTGPSGDINGQPYANSGGLVTKFDADGNLLWSRQFVLPGVIGGVRPIDGVAVDDQDVDPSKWSVYVTGYFSGSGTFGSQTLKASGSTRDAYVSRLSAASGVFTWTKLIGGAGDQIPEDLAISTSGSRGLYVLGNFGVVKMDLASGNVMWTRGVPVSSAIAASGSHVFIQGVFSGVHDFNPGAAVFNLSSAGGYDIGVVALDSNGSFAWAQRLGGVGEESTYRANIAAAPDGGVYTTGGFSGVASFGNEIVTSGGSRDGFLTKLDASGAVMQTYRFPDYGLGVSVDAQGTVYVGGRLDSHVLPGHFPSGDTLVTRGNGYGDLVLLKFSTTAPPIEPTPSIDGIIASATQVASGDPLSLSVIRVHDPDQRFRTIAFYLDNGDGVLNSAEDPLFGVDADPSGGWSVSASTAGLMPGMHTMFAQAVDETDVVLAGAAVEFEVVSAETVTYVSTTGRPIDDLATVSATLVVPDAFSILDVDVTLHINHTFVADLDVFLVAPDGTRVELFTDINSSGANLTGTTLDDEAASPIVSAIAPFSGRFTPEGQLAVFNGRQAQGAWKLEITDDARKDKGFLSEWSLSFTRLAPLPTALNIFADANALSGLAWTTSLADGSTSDRLRPLQRPSIERLPAFKRPGESLDCVLASDAESSSHANPVSLTHEAVIDLAFDELTSAAPEALTASVANPI